MRRNGGVASHALCHHSEKASCSRLLLSCRVGNGIAPQPDRWDGAHLSGLDAAYQFSRVPTAAAANGKCAWPGVERKRRANQRPIMQARLKGGGEGGEKGVRCQDPVDVQGKGLSEGMNGWLPYLREGLTGRAEQNLQDPDVCRREKIRYKAIGPCLPSRPACPAFGRCANGVIRVLRRSRPWSYSSAADYAARKGRDEYSGLVSSWYEASGYICSHCQLAAGGSTTDVEFWRLCSSVTREASRLYANAAPACLTKHD